MKNNRRQFLKRGALFVPAAFLSRRIIAQSLNLADGPFITSMSASLDPVVTTWASRVVANGGADPSAATKSAVNTFVGALKAAAIDTKMLTVCLFVPDSLIAAITPLYKIVGNGNDPWTNNGFIAGDLTVNGLVGNGSTKWLAIGTNPSTIGGNLFGLSVYCSSGNANNEFDIGSTSNGQNNACFVRLHWTTHGANSVIGGSSSADSGLNTVTGFWSANRTSTASHVDYLANSITPFGSVAVDGANNGNAPGNNPMSAFCAFIDTANSFFSTRRYSFMAFHQGLTSPQAQALYNAVQAFRTTLGGGFV